MSRSGQNYQVARCTGQCAATGVALVPGTAYMATLCERPDDDGFDRRDVSLEAWEAGTRPEGLFSYWKAVVPTPGKRPHTLVDERVLMDLFERLQRDERPTRRAFRFVLALILMRKKRLKFIGRAGEGSSELWNFHLRGDDQPQQVYEVVNPHLNDDDVRAMTEGISEILDAEV